jgi:hypothetical protein
MDPGMLVAWDPVPVRYMASSRWWMRTTRVRGPRTAAVVAADAALGATVVRYRRGHARDQAADLVQHMAGRFRLPCPSPCRNAGPHRA